MLLRILSLLIVTSFCSRLESRDWAPLPIIELVAAAELVVYGELFKENDTYYVAVAAVLKGEIIDTVRVGSGYMVGPVLIKGQETGIYFLRRRIGEELYRYFHPACFQEEKHLQEVERAVDLWDDPAKYVSTPGEEGADVNYVLGRSFAGWRIHSEEASFFVQNLSRYYRNIYEKALWEEKEKVTLTVSVKENNDCSIRSDNPTITLSKIFSEGVRRASQWDRHQGHLPAAFTITIDNTKKHLPDLSYEEATVYLREQLKAEEPAIIISAIQALCFIGDPECIPQLISLIQSSNAEVALKAIEALGWSKSTAAIVPIGSFMLANTTADRKQYHIPTTAAVALRNINDPSCVPYLEAVAKFGYQRVFGALGTMGREESVRVLIEAIESNPNECFDAVTALTRLVARSNYEVEEWMESTRNTDGNAKIKIIPRWIAWSKKLKDDFEIIKP